MQFIYIISRLWGLNLLFASTRAGANRSYYGSSYTIIGAITEPAWHLRIIHARTYGVVVLWYLLTVL